MSRIVVHEYAEVAATFTADGTLRPLAFVLRGRSFRIQSIKREWTGAHGSLHFYYFEVLSGEDVYTLCYVREELRWMIEEPARL